MTPCLTLQATIANSDLRHGIEFDSNQETSLVRGSRPLIDFNERFIYRWLLVMYMEGAIQVSILLRTYKTLFLQRDL